MKKATESVEFPELQSPELLIEDKTEGTLRYCFENS